MKILHLNTYDANGGAAIAARRLCEALNKEGISALLGCQQQNSDLPFVLKVQTVLPSKLYKIAQLVNDYTLRLFIRKNASIFTYPFLPLSFNKWIKQQAPDIIHLHWISGSFLSSFTLRQIAKLNIPIVWTLHDTWAFTGGCHYYDSCSQWRTQCVDCHQCLSFPLKNCIHYAWKLKRNVLKKINPHIVALSNLFKTDIESSAILKSQPISKLPNCIDTNCFKPLEKKIARKILGLYEDKKYILFGAVSVTSDKRKGFDLLQKALLSLPNKENTECLIFGASHAGENEPLPLPTHYLGRLHDEISLALVYAAADVFVCPSREENLPNTIMEALACGTPVVAFSVGGIPDMIEHGVNGMLAKPHNPEELAQGIAHILENKERRESMGKAARKIAEGRYSMPVVAKQYIALYEQIISKNKL